MPDPGQFVFKDSVGGAAVRGFTGRVLELDAADLFALDFSDAPALELIHLKRLQPGKQPHLTLFNLPALRTLILPREHPPAVIHFAALEAPDGVLIDGAVSELDAAWEHTQLAIQREPGKAAWTAVRLGADPVPRSDFPPGALQVLTGGQHGGEAEISLSAGKDWLLTDLAELRCVHIHSAGQVRLQRLPQLTVVQGHAAGLSLHLDEVPALTQIGGEGDLISIRQSKAGATHLEIAAGWKHARLYSPNLRTLHFRQGRSLLLHDCGSLQQVEAPLDIEIECNGTLAPTLIERGNFHFDESSLNACIEQLRAGDASQLDGILMVLASAHHRTKLAVTLQRLAALCTVDVPPAQIWATRRELAARHLAARHHARRPRHKHAPKAPTEAALQKADTCWQWDFAPDLAPQGWEADLHIWCHCMTSVPAAAEYADIIRCGAEDRVGREALVRLAGAPHVDPALFRLAVTMLEHLLRQGNGRAWGSTGYGSAHRLGRLLGSPHADPHAHKVVVASICETVPLHTLLEALPTLLHLAPGLFRTQLLALSNKPEHWFENRIRREPRCWDLEQPIRDYRQRLLQMALAPCPLPPHATPSTPLANYAAGALQDAP